MAQQLGQMNLTGRESCLLKPLIPGTNGETRRQVIDSEKGVSRHILLSDGGTNLFIDPEISDDLNDELTRTKVGLWGNFVNDANAGTKDTVANRSHEVSWEDVQEGLEQATETFIHINARRENPSSTFAPTSTDVAGTPSTKEPPTPVLADLIEFD
ncbi:hypothetical protein N7450_006069 [Penicillium hetheringtonii]|uniref:Uncharacterized protein n=1 Tax=Penicillium hetheringtonii TaxID=911720 RepID=A0AAD6GSX3_9EURO|nr:hypothetical protein N7450_006069 [Penicillium hetheringtonii]